MEEFIITKLIPTVLVLSGLFLLFSVFVWVPAHVVNEMECLEKGYPVTSTTVTLKGYCMNLEGGVTGKVEPL